MKVPAKIIFSLTLMNEKHCLFSEEGFKKPTYLTLSYLQLCCSQGCDLKVSSCSAVDAEAWCPLTPFKFKNVVTCNAKCHSVTDNSRTHIYKLKKKCGQPFPKSLALCSTISDFLRLPRYLLLQTEDCSYFFYRAFSRDFPSHVSKVPLCYLFHLSLEWILGSAAEPRRFDLNKC